MEAVSQQSTISKRLSAFIAARNMAFSALTKQRVDDSSPLQPTRLFFIEKAKGYCHSVIFDFTDQLQGSFGSQLDSNFMQSAQTVRNANPATEPIWRLVRKHWYSNSEMTVTATAASAEPSILATWRSPVLAMGRTTISFGADFGSSHDISTEPVAIGRRAQGFVKDSAPYLWETSAVSVGLHGSGRGTFSLFRSPSSAPTSKKIEIARYQSSSGKYEVGGVLIMNERELSPLVCVLTLLAVLSQRDSFNNVSSSWKLSLGDGVAMAGP